MKKSIQLYVVFLQCDVDELTRILSQIKFLWLFSKYRSTIYKTIYSPALDILGQINKQAFYFRDFIIDQPVDFIGVLKGLKESNRLIFKKEEKDGIYLIWTSFENTMFDSIEKFRCRIYNHKYIEKKHNFSYHSISE